MKGTVRIDREVCKGCNYCVLACPKGSLALEKDFNRQGFFPAMLLHAENCTGCALCAVVCPEIAIEVWRQEKAPQKS